MTEEMKLSDVEALLSEHGCDLALWPKHLRPAGRAFAATKEGQLLFAAENTLEQLLVTSRAVGPEAACDGNSGVFLGKLMDIPTYNQQNGAAIKSRGISFWLKNAYEDVSSWLSHAGAVPQATAFVAVLFVGVFVGMNSTQIPDGVSQQSLDAIDISENLFVSGFDYTLDEQ